MKKLTQIFTIMKYQKKVLNIFVYQQLCLLPYILNNIVSVFRTGKNYYPN